MFVRRRANPSGSFSVQIVDKSTGKYRVVQSFGAGRTESELKQLEAAAQKEISRLTRQGNLELGFHEDSLFLEQLRNGIQSVVPVGPELVLGKLYDEIGFNVIPEILFRHLVISRLVNPGSKLKTIDYLRRYHDIDYEIDEVYRYMDKIHDRYQNILEEISFHHTREILGDVPQMVFYDVTTLYFEAEDEDDLRKTGFSKDGKHQNPQIVLGLLVGPNGYPLAFQVFEGNTFEGHTLIPTIEQFKARFDLKDIIVVADAGLLSAENLKSLSTLGYTYILGAKIKNETAALKQWILSLNLKDKQSTEALREDKSRLVISYSTARAKNDLKNRKRGLTKLESSVRSGKLTKKNINNRGYNKYLSLTGEVKVEIDYHKFNKDQEWDGLKGYITNTQLPQKDVISSYGHLWQIEKAFRISKTDLRIRPIYHRRKRRIQTHLCIAFAAYKLYKELERRLSAANSHLSIEKAIGVLKTIFDIKVITPMGKKDYHFLFLKDEDQRHLLSLLEIRPES